MSKMSINRKEPPKWVPFNELETGDLFVLSTTSDVFQRINLNTTNPGNCICLYTGELRYVIPTENVILVNGTLKYTFGR